LEIYRVMMAFHISKRTATPREGSGHLVVKIVGMMI